MAEEKREIFDELFKLNVNEHVEKKQNLSYLSWSWAWAEVKKRYPQASYEVVKFENGLPYAYDPKTGYMVYTKVTINETTHEMWLPVMDNNNNTMLDHAYEYTTKYGKKIVAACTMFEVNKAIMRCLVKNLAMFGLGLYIYSGEDLPEEDSNSSLSPAAEKERANELSKNPEYIQLKTELDQFLNADFIAPESKDKIRTTINNFDISKMKAQLAWCKKEQSKAGAA